MSTTPTKVNNNNSTDKRFSRRKRSLEPEQIDTNQTPKTKKLKSYTITASELDLIKSFIANMKSDIENKITTSQSSIETKINELTSTVNTEVNDLKVSVEDMKAKVSSDIESLKQHVTEHKQRLDNNEDDINRLKLSADLRMNGIPFKQGENLIELFYKIATAIGYDSSTSPNVPFIKRIPIHNKVTGSMIDSSIISLHFPSIQHKQSFYSYYLKKMPLKPEDIGLSNNLKIIIGESLTRLNAQIFKFAQNLKKENKIAQTFTADGLVKITKTTRAHNSKHHTTGNINKRKRTNDTTKKPATNTREQFNGNGTYATHKSIE